MGGRLAAAAPAAASLLAHGVLLAGLGWVATRPAPAPRATPSTVQAPASVARLVLLAPDGGAGGTAPAFVSLDDPDPVRRPYLDGLRARIWGRWQAPALAGGAAPRGALSLEFVLGPGGDLAGSAVVESSGSPALDRAALDAVRAGAPFPPVPPELAAGQLRVRARFVYE